MKRIALLGSTGSIGVQALDVVRKHGFTVTALSANKNISLLEQQAREFHPRYIAVTDRSAFETLKGKLSDTDIVLLYGLDGLCETASLEDTDIVLNALVGMIGIRPTLAAIEAGKDIALANKETLVVGGELVLSAAKRKNVRILPVDSEHSAIFQCINGFDGKNKIHKVILTASGGPFFGRSKRELEKITMADALKHPNWSMGPKITVDSATLMNKGLELIEAMWLFDISPDQIEIIVHRESIIHSLVEFADHSVLAQLGVPDMKIPIQYALTYPQRLPCDVKRLSLTDYGKLTFAKPDMETFGCLQSAIKAAKRGGLTPCVLNGANEMAVELFLREKISFVQIAQLVQSAVEQIQMGSECTLEAILEADRVAREYVQMQAKA